jgi:hypothetical protein
VSVVAIQCPGVAELIIRELRLRPFTDVAAVVDREPAVDPTSQRSDVAVTTPASAGRLVARHSRRSAVEERVL